MVYVPSDDCEAVHAGTKAKHDAEARQMKAILAGRNDRAWVVAMLERLGCEIQE